RAGHGNERMSVARVAWVTALASLAACHPSSRAGTGGSTVLSSEPTPSATVSSPPPPVVESPPAPSAAPSPVPAPTPSRAPAPSGSTSSLLAQCPRKFSQPRYAHCKWSTGPFRRCGGAMPLDDDGRPHVGCVCNECDSDRDCVDQGRPGHCVEFPDAEGCGPPAKGCVYRGDPCEAPSTCNPPDRCMHDALGHPSCSAPPVPHM